MCATTSRYVRSEAIARSISSECRHESCAIVPITTLFSGLVAAPARFLLHRQLKPKARGALLIKIGLTLYDTFSRDGGSVPRHRFHAR